MRREKGDTARKLHFAVQDLEMIKRLIDLSATDHLAVWCVALLGFPHAQNERIAGIR